MLYSSFHSIFIVILLSSILILMLILFISFLLGRYQQRQIRYLKEMAVIEKRYQGNLLKAQMEMQEGAFRQISRELHDNFGQRLSFAKLQLTSIPEQKNADPSLLASSIDILTLLAEELRDFSKSLSHNTLGRIGLPAALEKEVDLLKKTGKFRVYLNIRGNAKFANEDIELFTFRIVQEALQNIVKHAQAQTIEIKLNFSEQVLDLEIKDDGIGFNAMLEYYGEGLRNMKERVDILGGDIKIMSTPDIGTELIIKIPLHEHKKSSKDLFRR